MFQNFLKKRKQKKALDEWNNSFVGKALAIHTEKYFKYPRLESFSEENKNYLINDLYQRVFDIYKAETPFLALREEIANNVICYARLQVLCLTEEEKQDAYSECPYISGDLHHHIKKAIPHNDELDKLNWKHENLTESQLVSFCNSRCVVYLYYINGFNYLREDFKDLDEEKDWLNAFTKSMLIWEEDSIRDKIGLPSLLSHGLDGLKHSTFMNLVVNGHENPWYEWEKSWKEDVKLDV